MLLGLLGVVYRSMGHLWGLGFMGLWVYGFRGLGV